MHLRSWATALLLSVGALAQANNATASSQHIESAFRPPQHWQHNNLVRSINLEKSYPREYVNVVIENISPSPQDEYYILFEGDRVGRVGSLEVKDKKLAGSRPFAVQLLGSDAFRCVQSYWSQDHDCTDIVLALLNSTAFACLNLSALTSSKPSPFHTLSCPCCSLYLPPSTKLTSNT